MNRHLFIQRFGATAAETSLRCRIILRMLVCALVVIVVACASPAWAQIYNVDTGKVIPGTQGITPGPGIDLSDWNTPDHELEFAGLGGYDLTNASFATSDLTSANLSTSTLTNANFYNANLTSAEFYGADFTGANLDGH